MKDGDGEAEEDPNKAVRPSVLLRNVLGAVFIRSDHNETKHEEKHVLGEKKLGFIVRKEILGNCH